jgi:hypothetical protein
LVAHQVDAIRRDDYRLQRKTAAGYGGVGADGDLAAPSQGGQESSFGGDGRLGGRVVQLPTGQEARGTGLNRQRTLTYGGTDDIGFQDLSDAGIPTQAFQTGGRQHDGVILAFIELAQARVQIAAHRLDPEVGPHPAQLRRAPQRAGAQPGARRQVRQPPAYQGIARIFPRRNRGQHQARRQLRRQILQTVYGQVGAAVQQGFLDFLGEQAFCAYLGERYVGNLVAGGFDNFDAGGVAQGGQLLLDPMRLPEGQLGSARCDD